MVTASAITLVLLNIEASLAEEDPPPPVADALKLGRRLAPVVTEIPEVAKNSGIPGMGSGLSAL
jgi:hypothetical protein